MLSTDDDAVGTYVSAIFVFRLRGWMLRGKQKPAFTRSQCASRTSPVDAVDSEHKL